MKTWIYKCNRRGINGPARGDWNDLFEKGDETWGADTLRGMKDVQRGDRSRRRIARSPGSELFRAE